MNPTEYEALVRSMVHELTSAVSGLGRCEVEGGALNRVVGLSGFSHQLDVTVRRPTDLLLVECKYWAKPVDVEPVLVLASRSSDIAASNIGSTLRGSIVSTQEPTAGAKVLAAYFGISIDTVKTPQEYALRIFDHVFAGAHEVAHATDSFRGDIIRGGG